jgi:tetratricopeptide (TPR) repeat protein
VLPDEALAKNAFALAKDERYEEALAVLDLLQDPNTAVALNYRGYATSKLGRIEEGIGYCLKSVALDPDYAQVREYLGEALSKRAISRPPWHNCRRSKGYAARVARNIRISPRRLPTREADATAQNKGAAILGTVLQYPLNPD